MSNEQDQNPPPPESLNSEDLFPDRIGNTVYSKHWIIKILMNIIEACDKVGETHKNSVENEILETDIVELDPKIEEDACALWDMSVSEEVGKFLLDSGICGIFLDVVEKTQSPRLLEIIVGIMANLSTFPPLCSIILENKMLMSSVLLLSGTSDSPTLIQVMRLIVNGLKHENSKNLWSEAYGEKSFFKVNVKDILSNSLNSSVILAVYDLLETTFSENIIYTELLGQDSFLEAFIVSGQQLLKKKECLDKFFCILNLLCQYSLNVEKFVNKWNEFKPLFYEYVSNLEIEDSLFNSKVLSIHSYFEAYNTLLSSGLLRKDWVITDKGYLVSVARTSEAVNRLILDVQKHNERVLNVPEQNNQDSSERLRHVCVQDGVQSVTMLSQYDFRVWNVLAESILETAKTLKTFVEKDEEREILNDILRLSSTNESMDLSIAE
ncbi:uncharacterized protein [Parasteatoda tepidariorum]|uniref:uncharacterized protein n=1 Tax=Parasteatoda tepidariorum TaxID=114398 RepID=UPI00077FC0A7|nr:uncharacterized protein LOC107456220 [Parasteatoda tepidariorum]